MWEGWSRDENKWLGRKLKNLIESRATHWPLDFEVFIIVLNAHLISDIMNTCCNLEDWKMPGRVFLHSIKVLYSLEVAKQITWTFLYSRQKKRQFQPCTLILLTWYKIFSNYVFGLKDRKYITKDVNFLNDFSLSNNMLCLKQQKMYHNINSNSLASWRKMPPGQK